MRSRWNRETVPNHGKQVQGSIVQQTCIFTDLMQVLHNAGKCSQSALKRPFTAVTRVRIPPGTPNFSVMYSQVRFCRVQRGNARVTRKARKRREIPVLG
jgi:hypothetical protein